MKPTRRFTPCPPSAALLLAVALLTPGCASSPDGDSADAAPPPRPAKFDTYSRSPGNRLITHGDEDLTHIEVYSDNGIGTAIVTLTDGDWPRRVNVRLHTRFLEQFRIATPDGTVTGISIQSGGDHAVRHDPPREADDPLALTLKIVDLRDPPFTPRLPIVSDTGYFEIALPPALLADNPEWIKLSWIDVYRR